MTRLRGLVALLLVLAAAGARAEECVPSSAQPEVDVAGIYFDNDLCEPRGDEPCLFNWWVYQESNGIPGLQRRDPGRDDTCGGDVAPDMLLL